VREPPARQSIRSLRTADGARLAWAECGRGPTLVKAANWMSHLELEWESPVWRHWLRFFSAHFRFVRFDERGAGMSDWELGALGPDIVFRDLSAVIEAATAATEPLALLGISQGAAPAIEYAVRHPERVRHLILYGGYCRGWRLRTNEAGRRHYAALIELIEQGWGRNNPVFRQLFTSRFIPGGSEEQLAWFNDLCRKTTTARNAARLLESLGDVDVRPLLGQVRAPTLVLHARRDEVAELSQAKVLASEIPGAEFVELDSANHILLEDEPAWARFCEAVLEFTGVAPQAAPGGAGTAFAELSAREREVLALLSEGLANAEIAARLGISDKTVRNHVSNLFDKLGVWSRAQAIVFARDHGFRHPA